MRPALEEIVLAFVAGFMVAAVYSTSSILFQSSVTVSRLRPVVIERDTVSVGSAGWYTVSVGQQVRLRPRWTQERRKRRWQR